MSQTVRDAIAAELEGLARLVPTPTGELGYGRDLSCVEDITETLDEVDPFSVRGIGEAQIRRLTTPRGSLPDDPDYGLDVRSYANRGVPQSELRDLAGQIRSECLKDDRLDAVQVTVTMPAPSSLRIAITNTPVDVSLGQFSLVLAVASGTVLVEALG